MITLNRQKLLEMPIDRITHACDIHAKAYKRHMRRKNTDLAKMHEALLTECVYVALEKREGPFVGKLLQTIPRQQL